MPTSTTPTLPEKFGSLIDTMNGRLVERPRETQTAVTALVGGLHVFYLGPPGTAKSLTVRTLVGLIDGLPEDAYFEYVLQRFTTPPELFGPPMLSELQKDNYKFNTKGKLPRAVVAFLDEIWKGNSSVLNSLLPIINEGIFYNDVPENIPLRCMFSASNELPQGEELNAMYDRIHFRHIVKPVQEQGNFITMLKLNTGELPFPSPVVTYKDVEQAQAEVKLVTCGPDVLEALNTLRNKLKAENIEPTDRRWASCLKVAQATAWLGGRTEADIDDLRLLRHVLWEDPKDIPVVDRTVLDLASPLEKEAQDLLTEIDKICAATEEVMKQAENKQVRNQKGIELYNKAERAKSDLDSIKKRAAKTNRRSDIIKQAHDRLLGVTQKLMQEIFGIDPSKVPDLDS